MYTFYDADVNRPKKLLKQKFYLSADLVAFVTQSNVESLGQQLNSSIFVIKKGVDNLSLNELLVSV